MEIYFYNENMRYVGHRKLNKSEKIPAKATTEVVALGDGQEAYFLDGKWVVSEIIEDNSYAIDKIKNIFVNPNKYASEITTMDCLKTGLMYLYNSVYSIEQEMIKKYEGEDIYFWGRNPDLPQHIFEILPCFFHWFGTSVCNYARLAGLVACYETNIISRIDFDKKVAKDFCDNYIISIDELSEVKKWRDKVAAHFAITDPRKENNITLEASIIYPVSFAKNRFYTGATKFSKIEGDKSEDAEIPKWSLTESFEALSTRFWPDIDFIKY